ncbi:MAG TPA: peptidoglycan-binding protein [Pseudonocardiaceae bacterium]|nr:peptidoglycan-binding protein [Pseudonocardiaceae bacterium]
MTTTPELPDTTQTPRRRRRYVGAAVSAAVLAVGAAAVGYAATARPQAVHQTTGPPPTGTATVTRGTVTERIQIAGTLGFGGSYSVIDQGIAGILTWAAPQGSTVGRGGLLFAVADQPVRLLIGDTPAYRDLTAGMTDGPDVRELETNLVALGMDPSHQITVDDHFTSATTAAIRRWQASWGLPAGQRTGTLRTGQVAFLPTGLRIGQVRGQVGASVGPDSVVLAATSTDRVVNAQLSADEQTLVHPGDQVVVAVGGQASVPGTVASIGAASTGPATGNTGGPATVPVTFTLPTSAGLPAGDQVPVQVAVTTASHSNVFLVPVTALLARPGGGYQVRVVPGGYVEVRPGLFDETAGTVEVSGAGLTTGQHVAVPTS